MIKVVVHGWIILISTVVTFLLLLSSLGLQSKIHSKLFHGALCQPPPVIVNTLWDAPACSTLTWIYVGGLDYF